MHANTSVVPILGFTYNSYTYIYIYMCSLLFLVYVLFSTALYSHFLLENETHKRPEKMEIAHTI